MCGKLALVLISCSVVTGNFFPRILILILIPPHEKGTHTDSYVAATEEVTEEPEQLEDETSMEATPDNDTDANYIYACNICGEQYTEKEECEKHLKVHTGSA